ncbi:hypothetical protein A1F94_002974 [Pyrenophora tritici-repentis]|uniref:Uncharacterized protein n=1 Tax=Pyrenophora tritici-repentis TaxID=45151 RepID=A0A922NNF2_9PLEO|nr:hypothetical protein A1F94_002974 [Pyrenophora tritici-repentis]KAI1519065.1 hypothetical protein Ptr86124_002193 [Pyrenophora tritici-repentis]KAI1686643.1 hypothetical protein KJE20_04608 [Pyrenophora tritici-repentis]
MREPELTVPDPPWKDPPNWTIGSESHLRLKH